MNVEGALATKTSLGQGVGARRSTYACRQASSTGGNPAANHLQLSGSPGLGFRSAINGHKLEEKSGQQSTCTHYATRRDCQVRRPPSTLLTDPGAADPPETKLLVPDRRLERSRARLRSFLGCGARQTCQSQSQSSSNETGACCLARGSQQDGVAGAGFIDAMQHATRGSLNARQLNNLNQTNWRTATIGC